MGRYVIEISTENAAFDDRSAEVARILRDTAARLESDPLFAGESRTLRDMNGNTVGTARYEDDETT